MYPHSRGPLVWGSAVTVFALFSNPDLLVAVLEAVFWLLAATTKEWSP